MDSPRSTTSPATRSPGIKSVSRLSERSKVLLPAPEGPMMPKTWPGLTEKLTFRTSGLPCARTSSPRASRIGATATAAGGGQTSDIGFFVDFQPARQGEEAKEEDERQQDQGGAPKLAADRGIERVLR